MPRFPTVTGSTPIDDASGLKLPIHSWEELIAAEANNVAKAISKYLAGKPSRRSAPFNVPWTLALHKEMFGDVWTWAGAPRAHQPNIGVPSPHIREELHNLLADLACWRQTGMPLIEQATRLHHRAVLIHPFSNGNGRWARMLANIWLKQHAAPPTMWPAGLVRESPIRVEYLRAIKEADQGNLEPLLHLHVRYSHGEATPSAGGETET